jgi:putative transcriptional regulator
MSEIVLESRTFETDGPKGGDRDGAQLRVGPEPSAAWDVVSSRALIHRVRWHTGLTQSEFADVYGIDLDHLKALEQGAVLPDKALVAYLTVIDRAPQTVRSALRTC